MTFTSKLPIPFALVLLACTPANSQNAQRPETSERKSVQTAIFAGGCFWCTEADFEKIPGVIEAVSGYTGGHAKNPSYKQVTSGGTGHYEAVKVTFDPAQVSYRQLVDWFWPTIDPTDDGGQFCDRGESYRPAVFATPTQLPEAMASLDALQNSGRLAKKIKTPVLPASAFYEAEKYHQDYYKKNKIRYNYYRNACKRDARLREVWALR